MEHLVYVEVYVWKQIDQCSHQKYSNKHSNDEIFYVISFKLENNRNYWNVPHQV